MNDCFIVFFFQYLFSCRSIIYCCVCKSRQEWGDNETSHSFPNHLKIFSVALDLHVCLMEDHPQKKRGLCLSRLHQIHKYLCTHTKSCRNTACLRSHTIIPEDACNSTTSPVGLSSVEGPLCPQITQSYIASETCCSDVATSMAISASGDSKNG